VAGFTAPSKRSRHSATLVGDHQVYIFGGRTPESVNVVTSGGVPTSIKKDSKTIRPLNDLHVFDARKMTWSKPKTRGNPPPPRYGHTATLVEGDKLYIIGGMGEKGQACTDVYILNVGAYLTLLLTLSCSPMLSSPPPRTKKNISGIW